jgi:hypothetical protein
MKTSTAGLLTAFRLSADPSHTIGDSSNRTYSVKIYSLSPQTRDSESRFRIPNFGIANFDPVNFCTSKANSMEM